MVEKISHRLHILTLVIKNRRDIPLVRSKARLLAKLCLMDRISRVKIAVSASEVARYLLEHAGGGTVSFLLICCRDCSEQHECAGIMLEFKARHLPHESGEAKTSALSGGPMESHMPFIGIRQAMDTMNIISEGTSSLFHMEIIKWGIRKSWDELAGSNDFLRRKLFRDTEESFVANLRAKHEEVLKLLDELSHKNRELDKANSELLQFSNDLEILAHERTMSEIALKVADRIRNPVTAIGGLARILLKNNSADSSIKKKLDVIFSEARRLEKIVKEFDALAKAKSKAFEKCDIREIVNSVLETLDPTFKQKGIDLHKKMTDSPAMALLNPQTIKVALLHIIRNAVEASPDNGIIEVTVWRRDGNPYISIRDFGPGINNEIMKDLFEKSVTTKATGTGMGLITVKQIMDEHKGTIKINSGRALGPGTEVILEFPVRWKE